MIPKRSTSLSDELQQPPVTSSSTTTVPIYTIIAPSQQPPQQSSHLHRPPFNYNIPPTQQPVYNVHSPQIQHHLNHLQLSELPESIPPPPIPLSERPPVYQIPPEQLQQNMPQHQVPFNVCNPMAPFHPSFSQALPSIGKNLLPTLQYQNNQPTYIKDYEETEQYMSDAQYKFNETQNLKNSKRAVQNRNAQKAFRLRKETYIRLLENKSQQVDDLKKEVQKLKQKNEKLKTHIWELEDKLHSYSTK